MAPSATQDNASMLWGSDACASTGSKKAPAILTQHRFIHRGIHSGVTGMSTMSYQSSH